MTVEECTDLLEPLAIAMRVQLDVPTYLAYHAMLKDIPVELAALGLDTLRQAGALRFFPTAPEIQCAAEKARRQQLALHPWSPCAECEDQPGWRPVTRDGVSWLERCPCKARHQSFLETRGLRDQIAVLPSEAGAGDERVYPTLDQLPEKLQKQVKAVAAQKVLR